MKIKLETQQKEEGTWNAKNAGIELSRLRTREWILNPPPKVGMKPKH